MAGWHQLPTELRWMVFGYIEEGYNVHDDRHDRAHCASVCREWQMRFEPQNFHTLLLDQHRLQDFADFVGCNERRRQNVVNINLRIRLNSYDCSACQSVENDATRKKNDAIFIETIWKFLKIVSKWENPRGSTGRIWLDLGVYSPSDGEHAFRDLHLTQDYKYMHGYFPKQDRREEMYFQHLEMLCDTKDACPGWAISRNGQQLGIGPRKRITSVVGDTRTSHMKAFMKSYKAKLGKLPEAKAIGILQIRRQFYRHISHRILRILLERSLTNLEKFHHEKWHGVNRCAQLDLQKDYSRLISSFPRTLRHLRLFEDFSRQLNPGRAKWNYRKPPLSLGRALAKASHNLERLSASFVLDAKDFFPKVWPGVGDWRGVLQGATRYPKMSRLVLTSQVVPMQPRRQALHSLLVAAVAAAMYLMPKLQLMEVWHYTEADQGIGIGWLLRLEVSKKRLEVTFLASFDAKMQRVVDEWMWMARDARPKQPLKVRVDESRRWPRSYQVVMQRLKLFRSVCHPLSHTQINHEGMLSVS